MRRIPTRFTLAPITASLRLPLSLETYRLRYLYSAFRNQFGCDRVTRECEVVNGEGMRVPRRSSRLLLGDHLAQRGDHLRSTHQIPLLAEQLGLSIRGEVGELGDQ